MSRSYHEEWERKKSYLIRSLFHDIPFRALSPVPECPEKTHGSSIQSSDTQLPRESSTSPEIYSEAESSASEIPRDPVPPSTEVYTALDSRPYSPLPPLIIERMPNKHDDPPEFYQKLLNKMRLIYRKMFIEGKFFSDDDYLNYSDDDEKPLISEEVFEMPPSLSDISDASYSFSDGYSADTEMSDVEESIISNRNLASNELEKHGTGGLGDSSKSNNNDESAGNNARHDYERSGLNIEATARDSLASDEEADYRQVTTQADVHTDGEQLAAVRPSPVYEEAVHQIKPESTEAPFLSRPKEVVPDARDHSSENESLETAVVFQTLQKCEKSSGTPLEEELPPAPVQRLVGYTSTDDSGDMQYDGVAELDVPMYAPEDLVISPILPSTGRFQRADDRGVQAIPEMLADPDANHTETTISSINQGDKSPEAQEDATTQQPVFVLRFSKTAEHSFVAGRQTTETAGEQETTPTTEDSANLTCTIEAMRTPRHEESVESNPIHISRQCRHTNDKDLTCERAHTTQQDISTMTSVSQDGCHKSTADAETSFQIDEVLTSIFNRSSHEFIEERRRSKSKKRSYDQMSAQNENVSWNELRTNFFVGTPKIFRLCSCGDHVCC